MLDSLSESDSFDQGGLHGAQQAIKNLSLRLDAMSLAVDNLTETMQRLAAICDKLGILED